MGKYTKDSKITRKEGWEDLKEDMYRFEDAFEELGHIYVDVFVNTWRIIGIQDRDRSQRFGRVSAALVLGLAVVQTVLWIL